MNEKQKNFVSAVIYVHNSELTIVNFINVVSRVFEDNFERYELIFVNDNSTDNSSELIHGIKSNFSNGMISIVNMSFYQGLEISMRAGLDLAIGDFVYEFDETYIDFNPELIMDVYYKSLEGFDIVYGSKGIIKRSSKFFYKIFNKYSETEYNLVTDTFSLISRRGINRVHSLNIDIPYRKAVYHNCGLNLDYIFYQPITNEIIHEKKMKEPSDTAVTSIILFTNIAYRISLIFTFLLMIITLMTLIYVIYIYFTGNPIEGYTTMMLLISGSFFGIFVVLAVVIKYLSILLNLVFRKQKYLISGIEKITRG